MLSKICKITLLFFLVFFLKNPAYTKSFEEKNVYNYFSALVSVENNDNIESLNYFNLSKELKESHESYIKKYLFSLVLSGKINKAINEIKTTNKKNFTDFFEAHLLLAVDNIKKKNYNKSLEHLRELQRYKGDGTFKLIISNFLAEYLYLFKYEKIKPEEDKNFGKLSLINKTLQSCYLGSANTGNFFENLVNYEEEGNSRYLFFYANYLITQNNILKAKEIFKDVNSINSTLLIAQSKEWLTMERYEDFKSIFSCENSNDIIAELFFIISNLYSAEDEIEKSNFYFNLSNFLNPKFKFNSALQARNFFEREGMKLDKTRDATVEFARRILKSSHIANKKRSLEKAREIAANLDY